MVRWAVEQALNKWKNFLLFLFLLLIPTQLGKHFWPEWSYVLGIRVDYLSPTIYFIDLIWIGLFLSSNKIFKIKNFKFVYLLLFLFVVINILAAENKGIAVYRWLRVFQVIWTLGILKSKSREVKKFLVWIIPVWILGEGLLALAQVVNGGSLNGWLYFLGERRFNFNTIGIAQMSVLGEGLVRAYGTFSHPNSLAGFVLVILSWWVFIKNNFKNKVGWWVIFWIGILTIFLSGSRLIWVLTLLSAWIYGLIVTINKKRFLGVSLMILGISILLLGIICYKFQINNLIGGWDKNSLGKRWELNVTALKMIQQSSWVGQGMGNYLVKLPEFQVNNYWLQPVHNILLLIISETGFLGFGILIVGLFGFYKNKVFSSKDKLILGIIIISGMWDHYWLTLPQNWWLLTIVLAII